MRHIPEDELHAYLDQGLSRSQCVEIERHLAGCSSCRSLRDGIAALRDRTTALLAELSPPRGFPPAFEVIRHRAAQRVSTRRRRVRAAAWAASLVAAVGVGWSASTMLRIAPGPTIAAGTTRSVAEAAPATVRLPPPTGAASSTLVSSPDPSPAAPSPAPAPARERREAPAIAARDNSPASTAARLASHTLRDDSIRAAKLAVLDPSPAVELPPLQVAQSEGGRQFGGIWRTMSWAGAQSEAGQSLPHIDGLPVLRVQVQANDQGRRPLMVVAQQLASGQVIQMIEGPASDVSELLSRRTATSANGALSVTVTGAEPPEDQAMAMQVGDRMLAITGALPSDSLRAMIRRINAEMRSK